MKRLFKTSISLLLTFLMIIPAFTFGASAEGQVYAIDGTNYVFLGAGETVTADIDGDGNSETYNTYTTLKDAIAALAEGGGVIGIVGEFTDPTTNGDSTFSDISGRDAITIRGIGDGAVFKFHHTLKFASDIAFENFKLHCCDPSTGANGGKYLQGGGKTVFGEGFTTQGSIYFSNVSSTSELYASTTFNSPNAHFVQINSSDYNKGTSGKMGTYELIFNEVGFASKVNINLGALNGTRDCYGNVNLYVNGGTFVSSPEIVVNSMAEGMPTGKISAIFNNGMASSFGAVAAAVDYVIKSGEGGKASIKTQATASTEPVFMFTPDEGKVPAIDGVVLLANAEGEYLLTPTASDATQTFEVTYIATSGDEATAAF